MVDAVQGGSAQTTPLSGQEQVGQLFDSGNILGAVMLAFLNAYEDFNSKIKSETMDMQAGLDESKEITEELTLIREQLGWTGEDTDKDYVASLEADKIELQGRQDRLNSNNQLRMIRLQESIGGSNRSIDMVSNALSKFAGTMDNTVGNMRR